MTVPLSPLYASQAAWEDAALSGFDAAKLIGFDASGAGVYELFAKNNTPGDEQTFFLAVPMSYEIP